MFRKLLVLVIVCLLASVASAVIPTASYEGDAIISGYQTVGVDGMPFKMQTYDTTSVWSASGGIATIDLVDAISGSDGAAIRQYPIGATDGSDGIAHIATVRMAVSIDADQVDEKFHQIEVRLPISSSSVHWYQLGLINTADTTDVDTIIFGTTSGAKGTPQTYTSIDVTGLDVTAMNIYEFTVDSSANLTLRVNGTSVYTTTLGVYNDDGGHFYTGLLSPRSTDASNTFQVQIDYIRVVPEPATVALLGLGGLALIRRKKKLN